MGIEKRFLPQTPFMSNLYYRLVWAGSKNMVQEFSLSTKVVDTISASHYFFFTFSVVREKKPRKVYIFLREKRNCGTQSQSNWDYHVSWANGDNRNYGTQSHSNWDYQVITVRHLGQKKANGKDSRDSSVTLCISFSLFNSIDIWKRPVEVNWRTYRYASMKCKPVNVLTRGHNHPLIHEMHTPWDMH